MAVAAPVGHLKPTLQADGIAETKQMEMKKLFFLLCTANSSTVSLSKIDILLGHLSESTKM